MTGNDFMSWVLRSPFHGILSDGMMLITVTGRKTGRKYTLPVSYYRDGQYLWVITSRNRSWWKNLRGGAKVDLVLKRRAIATFADTVLDENEVEQLIVDYVRHSPMAARGLGVRLDGNIPNGDDVARLAKERLFVRIKV